jgi:hypothetical protein
MADHREDPDAPAGGGGPGYFRVPRQPKSKGMHQTHKKVSLMIFPGEAVVRHTEGTPLASQWGIFM